MTSATVPFNSRDVRTALVEALHLDLVGPPNDHACAHELLPESPYKWYLTGYLVPTGAPDSHRHDETSSEEIDEAATGAGADDDQPVDRLPGGRSFLASSVGLSVLAGPETGEIALTARWGDYHWEAEGEETGDVAEAGEESEGKPAKESGKSPKGYRREGREETVVFKFADLQANEVATRELPNSRGVELSIVARPLKHAAHLDLPAGAVAVSAFLVNSRAAEADFAYRGCIFQAELELSSSEPLLPQPDLRGLGSQESHDWDDRLADLQYRGIHDFAVGHGVGTAAVADGPECRKVHTVWLPSHEVERVAPSPIEGVEFGMAALAEMDSAQALGKALGPLVSQYRQWIADQEKVYPTLNSRRRDVAGTALGFARSAADRMERGIKTLAGDPDAFTAFRIANRAMARAASRRLGIDHPAWRPFQLAFILMNLPGLIDDAAEDREIVDLLFFPTGGGKTEAYLGLAAFTMVLRRLRNPGVMGCGLSVLMRYTLRLLTLDQLGRAAGLMCALELEREGTPTLGEWPFEIGLWVGSAATPNRMGGRKYKGPGREYTAYHKVSQFRRDSSKPSPIPLENCPWCGTKFGRHSFALTPNEKEPTNLVVRCSDLKCEFSGHKRDLPILTVDEPIYRRLPAFLIATVDKFAALPWEGRAGALLGHVSRHDKNGFHGPADKPSAGEPTGGPLPGPELIIQDELHLISGPLGTIAGIYETAIENLASRKIQGLFGRSTAAIFPPQGPDLRDTFFAKTETTEESNGRLYLGIAAQGRSLKVVLMRAALALLCSGQKLYDECGGTVAGNPADPYMTFLGYFNSLRELGGSRRIIEDEVVSRAQKYGARRRRAPKSAYFHDRNVDYEPRELTSRVSTASVAETKRLLELCFDGNPKDGKPVDVALATNMISVGLDITRLGLMVVLGQPKTSSEYIQATSRVGRDKDRPGLVVTLLNIHKPRDRSHYEHFQLYHRTFYRAVEAAGVTPFSPRALDRALAAALVAVCRHSDPELTPALGASEIAKRRKDLDRYAELFAERAEHHNPDLPGSQATELHDKVLARCKDLLDTWFKIQQLRGKEGTTLQYQKEIRSGSHPALLHDFLTGELPSPSAAFRKFRAARSMRDVEPSVEIERKAIDEPL